MVFKLNVSAMVFGLGYIVGLKYSAIIAAGSFLSWFVLIPLFYEVGHGLAVPLGATATKLIADMSAEEIFRDVRAADRHRRHRHGGHHRHHPLLEDHRRRVQARRQRDLPSATDRTATRPARTQTDIKMLFNVLFILLAALAIFVFFYAGVVFNLRMPWSAC